MFDRVLNAPQRNLKTLQKKTIKYKKYEIKSSHLLQV